MVHTHTHARTLTDTYVHRYHFCTCMRASKYISISSISIHMYRDIWTFFVPAVFNRCIYVHLCILTRLFKHIYMFLRNNVSTHICIDIYIQTYVYIYRHDIYINVRVWHSCPTTRNEAVGMSGKGNMAGFLYLQRSVDTYIYIIIPPLGAFKSQLGDLYCIAVGLYHHGLLWSMYVCMHACM